MSNQVDTASCSRMVGGRLVPELFDLGSEGADGEGWTGLVDALQFTVAHDFGFGEVGLQGDE